MAKFTPKVVTTVTAAPAKFRLTDKFRGRVKPVSDDNVIALADSMRTRGQQQAVQVRAVPGTDEYEGIFGNTRIRAGQLIANGYTDAQGKEIKGDPTFRLRADVIECTDEEALVNNLIENEFRNAVSPIDRMQNYETLRTEHDMSDAAIARLMGRDPAEISRIKKLSLLPEYIRDDVASGKLTLAGAYLLAGAKDVIEANAWEAVWAKRGESDDGDIGATEVAAMLKAWRTEQKAAANPATDETGDETGDETEGSEEGSTDADATPDTNNAIPLTAKAFKDTFKELAEDKECPEKTRKMSKLILDYYAGTLEAKVFVHALMKFVGEKPSKRKPEAPTEAPAAETPAEEPAPEETPAEEPAPKGKGKKAVKRK